MLNEKRKHDPWRKIISKCVLISSYSVQSWSYCTELPWGFTFPKTTNSSEPTELDGGENQGQTFSHMGLGNDCFLLWLGLSFSYFQSHVTHNPTFILFADAGLWVSLLEKFHSIILLCFSKASYKQSEEFHISKISKLHNTVKFFSLVETHVLC